LVGAGFSSLDISRALIYKQLYLLYVYQSYPYLIFYIKRSTSH